MASELILQGFLGEPLCTLQGGLPPDFVYALPKLVISFWGRINMWRKNPALFVASAWVPLLRCLSPSLGGEGLAPPGPWGPSAHTAGALSGHRMLPVQEQLFQLAPLKHTPFPRTSGPRERAAPLRLTVVSTS